jgi:hypothetical protein
MIPPQIIVLLVAAVFALSAAAGYNLTDSFTSANIGFQFTHFTSRDPTRGFVQYVDHNTAISKGLVGVGGESTDAIYLGVDHTEKASDAGRASVRLTSKKSYNHGLFVADISHMPANICGVWPAFWLLGPDWPKSGEIDILEGVNDQSNNAMTLHTNADCSVSRTGFSGKPLTSNCDFRAPGQGGNQGCLTSHPDPKSYGAVFNSAQGGVYATEWTSTAIKIWFFSRSDIPLDIASRLPDPSTWGIPSAQFAGECDIDAHFQNMQIVINTTFCGVWAGAVWASGPCATKAKTCEEYVANNPQVFKDAHWLIESINVYQDKVESHRLHGVRREQED